MLIVAHRLATVKNCDRIILLENGEIMEQGTHEELLEKEGRYYQLWEMQQGNFLIREEEVTKEPEAVEDEDDEDALVYL